MSWESCLEADTVIIQGLKEQELKGNAHPNVLLIQPRVEFSLPFFDHIASSEGHTESIGTGAAKMIGSL